MNKEPKNFLNNERKLRQQSLAESNFVIEPPREQKNVSPEGIESLRISSLTRKQAPNKNDAKNMARDQADSHDQSRISRLDCPNELIAHSSDQPRRAGSDSKWGTDSLRASILDDDKAESKIEAPPRGNKNSAELGRDRSITNVKSKQTEDKPTWPLEIVSRKANRLQKTNRQDIVSITYEEIGFFPRSFNRVFDRFLKQVFSDVENLVIQEYRFYRYLFLTTLKCVLILFFVPFIVNYLSKTYLVSPLTEYFWNTQQTEIFLNSYQQKRAFTELKDFEEKLYFESLINCGSKINPFKTEVSWKANHLPSNYTENTNAAHEVGAAHSNSANSNNKELIAHQDWEKSVVSQQYSMEPTKWTAMVDNENVEYVKTNIDFLDKPELSIKSSTNKSNPNVPGVLKENRSTSNISAPLGLPLGNNVLNKSPLIDAQGLNTVVGDSEVQSTPLNRIGLDAQSWDLNKTINHTSERVPTYKQELFDPAFLNFSDGGIKKGWFGTSATSRAQQRLQDKTIELAIRYNKQSIEAITNFFADLISFMTLCYLLILLEIQINITKSFLLEVFFGLDDGKKSLLILLITDLLVGYHSSNLWELFFEFLFNHYGLPESQTGIFLLVATLPVLLDVLFKYLIFRHLNRSSPATVATYHAIIE
jgi:hypothetical protein